GTMSAGFSPVGIARYRTGQRALWVVAARSRPTTGPQLGLLDKPSRRWLLWERSCGGYRVVPLCAAEGRPGGDVPERGSGIGVAVRTDELLVRMLWTGP